MSEGVLVALGVVMLLAGTGWAAWGLFRARPAQPARWCIGAAGYVLLLVLVARGLTVRGLPLSSAYEAGLLAAAGTALAYALLAPGRLAAPGGVCAGICALLVLALAALAFPAGSRVPHPPPAALSGVWFPLHVGTTAVGEGGLLLAGAAGLVRLFQGNRGGERSPGPALVPTAQWEALIQRGLAWGYPLLTLGMTFGAVWGWQTWGHYWSWSVKEVLTLLTWGLFTLALHTRRLKGWSGRVHSAVLAAGLAAVLVTLLGAEALARWAGMGMAYVF